MKVVLINPPQPTKYSHPPIGLALIAAVLEREGYRVSVVDIDALRLKFGDLVSYVNGADVVGLTAMTPTINVALRIAHQLKQAQPNLTIILGGVHATLLPGEILARAPQIDIVVRGEGEETILGLLQALEHRQPLDGIPGISFRRDGEVVNTIAYPAPVDLDSLPFVAYHLLPRRRYRPHPPHGKAFPFAAIITSRGCPYRCSYCSKPVFGYKYRAQSPERVVKEVAYYKEKMGIKEIAFYDDVFTLHKKRAYAIAEGIMKKRLKIWWTCETRVDLVDRELLYHMKQAGCYAIAYGIESASQKILNTLNKGTTPEQVEEAVHITRDVGLQTIGYFMLGSPGENSETIGQTIEFSKKLKLDFAQFGITIPFPGTKLYDFYLKGKQGHISWENFIYEGTGRKILPVFESDVLNRDSLQHWVKQAYKEFYLRPLYIWQRIRRVTSLGDLRVDVKGFSMLLGNI